MKILAWLFCVCISLVIVYSFTKQKVTSMAAPFSFTCVQKHVSLLQEPRFFTSVDNEKLAYYEFVPQLPKATLIFYHGGGMWSNGLYQHMAQELCDKYNIAVYLFDIRGHGNSGGVRGDAPTAGLVWRDIDSAIDFVKLQHKNRLMFGDINKLIDLSAHPAVTSGYGGHGCRWANVPVFLAGHSSGAGLVLNYASQKQNAEVAGYLFLSPFLGARTPANREHKDASSNFVKKIKILPLILNGVSGGRWFNNTPAVFFNYPEELKKQDAHILEYYTCAMAAATTPQDAHKQFEQLSKPFGLFIGSDDEQFFPQETIAYKNSATHVKQNSIAEVMPGETHLSAIIAAPRYFEKAINSILTRGTYE